ncbi:hypothetical protein OK016_19280 [Vibrio chagasii]|nr:hypothetical protein [Vibrio chagasii]
MTGRRITERSPSLRSVRSGNYEMVPARDDVAMQAAIRLPRTITDATGGNFESLVKDQQQQRRRPSMMPTRDVTNNSEFVSGCVSHRRRENDYLSRRHTRRILRWRRR